MRCSSCLAVYYKPSQRRTASSICLSWSTVRSPSFLLSFACVVEVGFCASKTPLPARNGTGIATSNRVPLGLVVWGMTVVRARSVSRVGMLRTRQGRVLAAYPRSTSHTSPRSALAIIRLAEVVFEKSLVSDAVDRLIVERWPIKIPRSADDFVENFALLR